MEDDVSEADLLSIKAIDQGKYRVPNKNPHFRRWELNLSTNSRPFKDLINCIAADSADCKVIALATENGLVYVFNFEKNKIEACIKAEHWIGSLVINSHSILISNYAFFVCQYALRSQHLVNRIPPTTLKREGFGPKGVIFTELRGGDLLFYNSGNLDFRLYHTCNKKVLKTFSPFVSENRLITGEQNSIPKRVMNYVFNKLHSIVMILLNDDPTLYLWDIKAFKQLVPIKLFEPNELPRGMNLLNSQMTTHACYVFVLLQFQTLKARKRRISSVLYVIKVTETGFSKNAQVVLYDKLGRQRSAVNGHELFMSQVIFAFEDIPNAELRLNRHSDGYILIIGTNTGFTVVSQIDLLAKRVIPWAHYQKLEGRLHSPGREEVSAMMLFKKAGSIAAMADGRIVIMQVAA